MASSRNLTGCQRFHPADLPQGWLCVPLGERIALEYGAGLTEEVRKPGPYPVYGSNGVVGRHNVALVKGPGLLVGRKGSVGAVHRSQADFWPIDTVYFVERLADDHWSYLQVLLEYLDLAKLNAATGVPGLSRRDAYALRGAFPPPHEQVAIARILDAADIAIERTRAALAEARRLKTSLAQNLFSRGLLGESSRQTDIGHAPQSWTVVSVGDLLTEAQYGLSMPMNAKGVYPILRMAAIQDGNIHLNDLKYVDLPEAIARLYLLARGDVLFNRTNSQELVGKVGVYRHDAPAVFASYLIRLKVNAELADNYFLGQLLASYGVQCRIKRFATPGVQQVNINATNLQRVKVALPIGPDGLDEQREIAGILERQDQSIRRFEIQIDLAERLKRGLMQDLLSGRVRAGAAGTVAMDANLRVNGAMNGTGSDLAFRAGAGVATR